MIALNLSFPLLYFQSNPLIVSACLSLLILQIVTISQEKKNLRTTLVQLTILSTILNYIGILLLFLPAHTGIPVPFLLPTPPPPQFLPLSTKIYSVLLPGLLATIITKKVLSFTPQNAIYVGLATASGSIAMLFGTAFQFSSTQ